MVNEILDEISEKIDELNKLPHKMSSKLSELHKEQIDIEHAIEMTEKVNAYEGWVMYNRMKEVLRERRKYKDMQLEYERAKSVLQSYQSLQRTIEKTDKRMEKLHKGLDSRKYTTRVIDSNDKIAQLNSVNKSSIVFKDNPQEDRMNKLFKQIKNGE